MASRKTIGWVGEVTNPVTGTKQQRYGKKRDAEDFVRSKVAYYSSLGYEPGRSLSARVGRVTRTAYGAQEIQYRQVDDIPTTYSA